MARAFTGRIGGVALGGVLALGVVGSVLAAEEPVTIENFAFDPADLTVSVGDTVTWSNKDSAAHTATADGGSFDTGTIAAGSSKSVTFSKAGTFTYHCKIHASMTARVVVEAASGGGGGGATTSRRRTPPAEPAPAHRPSRSTSSPRSWSLPASAGCGWAACSHASASAGTSGRLAHGVSDRAAGRRNRTRGATCRRGPRAASAASSRP